jgi:hypothetical protein
MVVLLPPEQETLQSRPDGQVITGEPSGLPDLFGTHLPSVRSQVALLPQSWFEAEHCAEHVDVLVSQKSPMPQVSFVAVQG